MTTVERRDHITPEWLANVGAKEQPKSRYNQLLRVFVINHEQTLIRVDVCIDKGKIWFELFSCATEDAIEIEDGPFTRSRLCDLWRGLTGEELETNRKDQGHER